jgi:curved DNA-binding protein CbpA
MSESFVNYYEVLQVRRRADQAEIKKAFRVLAKRFHPDANPQNTQWAERRMKQIMTAYRVLADDHRRTEHDARIDLHEKSAPPSPAPSREGGAAASVLSDLLDGHGPAALRTYDNIFDGHSARLFTHLTIRDYLDCIFLLAEQMERAQRFQEAADLYEELYREEVEPPRQRYFFDEVRERLKNLYVRKLARKARDPRDRLRLYRRLLSFELEKADRAFVYKKMAEVFANLGETEAAREHLDEALALRPNIKGITKLLAILADS